MNELKSILVHVDASPGAAVRVHAAAAIARACGAEATAVFAVRPVYMQYPYSLSLSAEAASMLQDVETERLARARAAFDQAASSAEAPVRWAMAEGDPVRSFARTAICHDLMVVGQDDLDNESRADVPPDFAASVIIDSGRPAIIVPTVQALDAPIGRTVLVAWKPTRESARALDAAMPLLRHAQKVHVALWSEPDAPPSDTQAAIAEVDAHLRRHGVVAEIHGQGRQSRQVGESLLSLGCDVDADLLVMGCYGHGRTREWVLGGASRTVLRSMTMPVLMAH
jgi:nucleotide-binding universal stress UspA family protein